MLPRLISYQGAFFLAIANISLTLAGPTPTNISWNSEPETEMKGTLASPAVALARRVLPVPGGPDNEKIDHNDSKRVLF
jgi:hypothetical protein